MKNARKYAALYVMMVPVVIYFLVYGYYPLVKGLQISFLDYRLMGNRPYIGFDNYAAVWNDPSFWEAFRNTIIIGGGILLFSFIAPLIVALSSHSGRPRSDKSTIVTPSASSCRRLIVMITQGSSCSSTRLRAN